MLKILLSVFSVIFLSLPCVAQTVPITIDVPVYDDTAVLAEIKAIKERLAALENTGDPNQPTPEPGTHANFETLKLHPAAIASWSLRDGEIDKPLAKYDPAIDGLRMVLPSQANEMPVRYVMLRWDQPDWSVGTTLVVQHEFMISKAMRELLPTTGENGRGSDSFKFTNLCRGNMITYELQTFFKADPSATMLGFRGYMPKLDGLLGRDSLSNDIDDPSYSGPLRSSNYDLHPGPDSRWGYRDRPPLDHPECFKARDGAWVRITYELVVVDEGTRVRVWLSDEDTPTKLVVSNPVDSAIGFLTDMHEPISSLYLELDTSQETTYAMPMPDRWAGFRNVVVLSGVGGDSVIGGN